MLNTKVFTAIAGLFALAQAGGLPDCYVDPYASALNSTTCGPLDVGCCCQSSTYLNALQDEVPQACDTAQQSPVFSYIEAACSEFGVSVTLTTTSMPLTTSTIPTTTTTITSTLRISGTAGADAAAISSDCPKQSLSTGASVGIIIAAFALGGLLFTAGALLMLRKRKTSAAVSESTYYTPYTPYTPYSESTAYSQSSRGPDKPLPMVEAETKRPRVEMMSPESQGFHGRPAELS